MDIDLDYQKALDYLYSFVDYSLTRNLQSLPDKFNLDRMRDLMASLGNPQNQFPVIHVAGTKGKGSVSALCSSALKAAGYKTGFYISPHLQDFAERIQINGETIPHAHLAGLVEELKTYAQRVPEVTTFELTTALAFWYFARQKVDAAVIEVGLGGRLDATNVVNPAVSVITSISYDHMSVLGESLSEIAREKAGIIKPGKPVVSAPQMKEAQEVIRKIAQERGSELSEVGKDTFYSDGARSLEGQTLSVWSAAEQPKMDEYIESGGQCDWSPTRLHIPLLGYHQVENTATAFTAIQVFRKQALPVSTAAIQKGFGQVQWPGRFEILSLDPAVIVDSAHNRDSALKLKLAIDDYFPGKPLVLVVGVSEDKDIRGIFAEMMPRTRQVIATRSTHPRAADPQRLVELAHQFGRPAQAFDTVEEALAKAVEFAGNQAVVVVAGSLFVAAAARFAWLHLKEAAK